MAQNHSDKPETLEQLGPQARILDELSKLETHEHAEWILVIFAMAVLVLGVLSLLVPGSFWYRDSLEVRLPPQLLFLVLTWGMVIVLYKVRRDMEIRKLRLGNLRQSLAAQSDQSASMVDSLTNVFNRSFLRDLLQGEIARAERNARALCLMMCDVNNFKQVNDRYGHLMGDYVLAKIAGILKSCVRGSDYVVRYGGDEFLVILPETEQPGAEIVRQRMLTKVADWDRTNRVGEVSISVSVGLYLHVSGQTAEQDISEVDTRMYAEKRASRSGPAEVSATPASGS